jgi:EamA domain-containing membrane protein RarD
MQLKLCASSSAVVVIGTKVKALALPVLATGTRCRPYQPISIITAVANVHTHTWKEMKFSYIAKGLPGNFISAY